MSLLWSGLCGEAAGSGNTARAKIESATVNRENIGFMPFRNGVGHKSPTATQIYSRLAFDPCWQTVAGGGRTGKTVCVQIAPYFALDQVFEFRINVNSEPQRNP